MNPYHELANAIVIRAAKDYMMALRKLQSEPNNPKALGLKKECERFFRSFWYSILTKVDGEVLMEKLKKEVEAMEVAA